jgi:17beta-estradiol 17-dehydrogenase / very-long-chain 3-oxoacyl-CoA reductase
VLVSLPEPRLHEAAAELESKYGVKTRTVPIELCKNVGPTTFATIRAALKDIEVGILVNCAGLYQPPAFLEELPDQRILDMLTINSYVPTMLCKMVLPDMRARGRGLVVNIGSATASLMQEAPLLQGYAATKAYLDNLSRSLDAEYAPFGVRVQCIWAAFVATRMTPNLTPSVMCPGPAAWAAAAVRQFGREAVIDPYPLHALIMDAGFKLMPKLSHRNTRRYSDEGRARELRAAGKSVTHMQVPSQPPARTASPRPRK